MTDSIPFTHDGKHYEIRCAFDGYTIHVRPFLDGRPANGFEYSVDLPVAVDFRQWTGSSAVQPLIDSAKNDIVNGSWEKIQEFFRRQKDVV
jgi:hypothetical protein